jgi:hypothetical protein
MEFHMQERERRRDAGVLQVTERDVLALTWIAEQYCISYDQLQRLLALYTPATIKHPDKVAPSTVTHAIERWLQLGYVDIPRKVIREHPTYVWLSRKGLKELDLPYAYYAPKPSTIRHMYAVNAIRLHMQSFKLSAEWIAQRTIRIHNEHRPTPDAHLERHAFPLAALQVAEQQRAATITLHEECTTLKALAERYTRIWYSVHAHIIEPLQAAIREDEQLANRIIWYGLDAKEIAQTQS